MLTLFHEEIQLQLDQQDTQPQKADKLNKFLRQQIVLDRETQNLLIHFNGNTTLI